MTKAEINRDAKIRDLGCIACYVQTGRLGTPGCSHHIVETGRRKGDSYTILLCNPGHHKDAQLNSGKEPFHHNKEAFEAAYGTQDELFDLTNRLIGYDDVKIAGLAAKPRAAAKKSVKPKPKQKKKAVPAPKQRLKPKTKPVPSLEAIAKRKKLQAEAKASYLEKNSALIEAAKIRNIVFMADRRRQLTGAPTSPKSARSQKTFPRQVVAR